MMPKEPFTDLVTGVKDFFTDSIDETIPDYRLNEPGDQKILEAVKSKIAAGENPPSENTLMQQVLAIALINSE
ncbi:MAG TPA: hypothetical protein VJL83_02590 [Patescibacteria group bacterium]|nr:hypothetical protein [Patescibacteria group bacterium]